MQQREGLESLHFVGYIDALSVIALVFVIVTAFTAIAFSLGKKAMLEAQEEVKELRAEIQLYQDRLRTTGFQNFQEIPNRVEWKDAMLTKQTLENTGWADRVAELPMHEEWLTFKKLDPTVLQDLTESEQRLAELRQKVQRYAEVLTKAGYTDITEIPPKEEWENSQLRLKSYQKLLEEVGFKGNIDTLYSFLEQWNKIILEMKRVFKVKADEPATMLKKLKSLEALQKKVVIPVMQGSIFFDSGQVRIQDEFKQILDAHIEEARQSIKNGTYDLIQIEGHTDRIPVRPDNPLYNDNWELSSARAHAVAQYFIERGIPPEHLAVVGHSEYKPKTHGTSSEEMAQNRRIEIVFLNTSLLNLELGE
jgi:flagellar motor protein MotB